MIRLVLTLALVVGASSALADAPTIHSMSSLAFSADGTLFIGDSRGGQIVAVEMPEPAAAEVPRRYVVDDIEPEIAALLGTTPDAVMIHDMAAHPSSGNVYLSVSRSRAQWSSPWVRPNDIDAARSLLRVKMDGSIEEASLEGLATTAVALRSPVAADKMHMWKEETPLRGDMITDMVLHEGRLYVTGVSNEEFASAIWQIPYPFEDDGKLTTVEVYHGAHGEYETHAPVRTFLPFSHEGTDYMIAAYLCTPLVIFEMDQLTDGAHVRGKTVAEFGSGNYPLDMVAGIGGDKPFMIMANSQLPLMTFDPVAAIAGEPIERETPGYSEGLPFVARASTGIQQMDVFLGEHIVMLQRMGNGKMRLSNYPLGRLAS